MAKRFAVRKGKDGLIEVDDGGGFRQATTYTQDGSEVRFSLAGDEGKSYTIGAADEDYDALQKAFSEASGAAEKRVETAEKKAEPPAAKA